jgi:hypothetical protein
MKNCRSCGDEDLIFQQSPSDMGVRTDQAMIADGAIVTTSGPHHSILHHYAFPSNADCAAALANDSRSVQNARAGADCYIAAHGGVWRDPSPCVYLRMLVGVRYQHDFIPRRSDSTVRSISVARVPIGQRDPSHIE